MAGRFVHSGADHDYGYMIVLLSFFFFAGSLWGCIVGQPTLCALNIDLFPSGTAQAGAFFQALLSSFAYLFICLFFATTFFGVLAIPALLFFRGAVAAFAVLTLTLSYGRIGLAAAAAYFLVPIFFELCGLLYAALHSISLSRRGLRLFFPSMMPVFSQPAAPVFLFAFIVTFVSFLWKFFISQPLAGVILGLN